jgi:hypothetical protein
LYHRDIKYDITAMKDLDGKPFEMPPWTTKSEGAATIITGMIDPRIKGRPLRLCALAVRTADNSIIEYNGAFLHDNAVADDELHSHILEKANWVKLWELSEKLVGEPFVV